MNMMISTSRIDDTAEFEALLRTMQAWPEEQAARRDEMALLMDYASRALGSRNWAWASLKELLKKHTKMPAAKIAATARELRVKSRLGANPETPQELVPLWLAAHGYRMRYTNQFDRIGTDVPMDIVTGELIMWADLHDVFKESTIKLAMNDYVERERMRIVRRAFGKLSHKLGVDPGHTELRKWLDLMIAPLETPETTADYKRAAFLVFSNFIHHVKNQMGAFAGTRSVSGGTRWLHHTHCMPVLLGKQEAGKTLGIKTLMRALLDHDLMQSVGFDFLTHDEKMGALATMPVMMFDELAGLCKADVEKIKGIMTDESRSFRKLYQAETVTRYVLSSFIGNTNKCVYGLIKDETGNRRYRKLHARWAVGKRNARLPLSSIVDAETAVSTTGRNRCSTNSSPMHNF
jgi:hypothetical protein